MESFAVRELKRLILNLESAVALAVLIGNKAGAGAYVAVIKVLASILARIEEDERNQPAPRKQVAPLVIIEGKKVEGFEAILIGGAKAMIIDWEDLEAHSGRAATVLEDLSRYFHETGLEPDKRVSSILDRLDTIATGQDPADEDIDDDPPADTPKVDSNGDSESIGTYGTYRGIPHTGTKDCPACKAFMDDRKAAGVKL